MLECRMIYWNDEAFFKRSFNKTSIFKKISRGIKVKKEQNFNMLNVRRILLQFNRLI